MNLGRLHGGFSTGPRTPEGLARLRAAKTKHGGRSVEMTAFHRMLADLRRGAKALLGHAGGAS